MNELGNDSVASILGAVNPDSGLFSPPSAFDSGSSLPIGSVLPILSGGSLVQSSNLPEVSVETRNFASLQSATLDPITGTDIQPVSENTIFPGGLSLTSGYIEVGDDGELAVDFLFDGDRDRRMRVGLFSLEGMESYSVGSRAFKREAARRVTTNSVLGLEVIADRRDGAKFSGRFPWERDFNTGQPRGEQTFQLSAGSKYGIMVLPWGSWRQVVRNPRRAAWISLEFDEPINQFNSKQIADVTGDGTLIGIERSPINYRRSDKDYNDIVFSVTGGTFVGNSLDELINPNRDWRSLDLGEEIIDYALGKIGDEEPPVIEAGLANDTGSSSSDGLTNDATITGTIADESAIASFSAGFEPGNKVSASAWLGVDGSYQLDREALDSINGAALSDGDYTLYMEALDARGNIGETEISFTLDSTAPILEIGEPNSGDRLTPSALLAGTLNEEVAQLSYSFDGLSETSVSVSEGAFETALDLSPLEPGNNTLRISTVDLAGNETQLEIEVSIVEEDSDPPLVTGALANDTGSSSSDGLTNDATITGTVTDDNTVVSLRAGFSDADVEDYVEIISVLDSEGNFDLDQSLLAAIVGQPLADGQHTLNLVASDETGNLSTIEVDFILDTEATSVLTSIDLLAASDSGQSDSDNITNDNTPTLAGTIDQVEPESQVLIYNSAEELIAQTEASSSWQVTTDQLSDGQQTLEVKVIDKAGNESFALTLEILVDTLSPEIDLSSPIDGGEVTPKTPLGGRVDGTGSSVTALSYQFDSLGEMPIPFVGPTGQFNETFNLEEVAEGFHTLSFYSQDLAGNTASTQLGVTVDPTVPFEIADYKPLDGGIDVGVTYKPQVFFSKAVNPESLNRDNFFASFGGNKLAAKIVPADNGEFAWLFFEEQLPDASSIRVTVDGSSIMSLEGNEALDADGDGTPGGAFSFDFSTVSLAALPNTALAGIVADPGPDLKPYTSDDVDPGADGEFHTADDTFLLPIEGVKVFAIGLEDEAIFTDADGRFRFDAMPSGNVKLVVDGLSATNAEAGSYFPEMVMDVNISPGVDNTVMFGMPEIFLPRLNEAILQQLDINSTTRIVADATSAPELSEEQRQFLSIDVQPNSLLDASGEKLDSGTVGISTVPPELVRDMLPAGLLQHTFDITVQAPGISNFSTPAPMTFPNVFDAAPGTQLDFLSFDHTTGRLVIEGTATVSQDGQFASTDPGTGITHPGWHGLTPPGVLLLSKQAPRCVIGPRTDETVINPPQVLDLIVGESGTFEKTWKAAVATEGSGPSSASCGEPQILSKEVKIQILGPLSKFMKSSRSSDFNLNDKDLSDFLPVIDKASSKTVLSFKIEPKSLEDMFNEDAIEKTDPNILYGSKIIITEKTVNTTGLIETEITPYYLYRLLDLTDADRDDGIIEFEDTLANGNIKRTKELEYRGFTGEDPPSLTTSGPFSIESPPFTPKFTLGFQPGQEGQNQSAELTITTPAGEGGQDGILVPGSPTLRGDGESKQKWYINENKFLEALKKAYNDKDATDETKEILGTVEEFDAEKTETLIDDIIKRVETLLKPFSEGIERVVSVMSGTIKIENFKSSLFDLATGTLAHAGHPDNKLIDSSAYSDDLSVSEQNFMLSEALNENYEGDIGLYVDRFFSLKKDWTRKYLLNSLSETIAHEIGHTLGLLHTTSANKHNTPIIFDDSDIMAQDLIELRSQDGDREFGITATAIKVALGLDWTPEEAQSAINDYFKGRDNCLIDNPEAIPTLECGGLSGNSSQILLAGNFGSEPDIELDGSALEISDTDTDSPFSGNSSQSLLAGNFGSEPDIGLDGGALEISDTDTNSPLSRNSSPTLLANSSGLEADIGVDGGALEISDTDTNSPLSRNSSPTLLASNYELETEFDPSGRLDIHYADTNKDVRREIDFGFLDLDTEVVSRSLRLINWGYEPVTLEEISIEGGEGQFSVSGITEGQVIGLHGHLEFTVTFDPSKVGSTEADLVIRSDARNPVFKTSLAGFGRSSRAYLTLNKMTGNYGHGPGNNNLGDAEVGSSAVENEEILVVTNNGLEPLVIDNISLLEGSDQFDLLGLPEDLSANPISLEFGESFTFGASFDPDYVGLDRALIEIESNDPGQPIVRASVVGTGVDETVHADWGNDFVAVHNSDLPGAEILRTVSDNGGNFEFFIAAEERYSLWVFDPETGLIRSQAGNTPVAGRELDPTYRMIFKASGQPDRDFDGLPDDIEIAIGTNPDNSDTDGDGIDDFSAIQQKIDPLGEAVLPIGLVSAIRPPDNGFVHDVVANDKTAYIASGPGGVQAVNLERIAKPIVTGSISASDLGGDALAVAFTSLPGESADTFVNVVAAAVGNGGLAIIDATDPGAAKVLHQVSLEGSAQKVEIVDTFAYVGKSDGQIDVVDLKTGTLVDSFAPEGSGTLSEVRASGGTLYTLRRGTLAAYDITANFAAPPLLSSLRRSRAEHLFVGSDRAYLTGFDEFTPIDISNPSSLAATSQESPTRLDYRAVASNGSGRLLVGASTDTRENANLSLFNIEDPDEVGSFLTQFDTPGDIQDIWIQNGLALVADGSGGLAVLNYMQPDPGETPPTLTVSTTSADGSTVVEGQRLRVEVNTLDDVQTSQVRVVANGVDLLSDGSFPFTFFVDVPVLSSGVSNLTLDVIATDTGGNESTEQVEFSIVEDTTAPELKQVLPVYQETPSPVLDSFQVSFNEPLAADSINGLSVRIVRLENGSEVEQPIGELSFEPILNLLTVRPAEPLGAGNYELHLNRELLTDRAGNAWGTGLYKSAATVDAIYQTGARPESIAISDLNNDGRLDIVVANLDDDSLSILLGNGDGTLQEARDLSVGSQPKSVALADLDADGDEDILVALGGESAIAEFLNDGTGNFLPGNRYSVANPPNRIALGDVDGDGIDDLVATYSFDGTVSVLSGNSDGSFGASTDIDPDLDEVTSVSLADLDADSDEELILSGYGYGVDKISVFGNGGAALSDLPDTYEIGFAGIKEFALGDLDGDGHLDLVSANADTNNSSVLSNNGDGSFAAKTDYPTSSRPVSVALGDLDSDGNLDVATANASRSVSVLLGTGNGALDAAEDLPLGESPSDIALGDFDGDGNLDVAVADAQGDRLYLVGNWFTAGA